MRSVNTSNLADTCASDLSATLQDAKERLRSKARGPAKEYIQALKKAVKTLECKASNVLGVDQPTTFAKTSTGGRRRLVKDPTSQRKKRVGTRKKPSLQNLTPSPSSASLSDSNTSHSSPYEPDTVPSASQNPDAFLLHPIFDSRRRELQEKIITCMNKPCLLNDIAPDDTDPTTAIMIHPKTVAFLHDFPRSIIDILVSVYFQTTGAIVPFNFIHPDEFNVETAHPLLVLAICASASRFAVAFGYESVAEAIGYEPSSVSIPGDTFFYRARSLAFKCFDGAVTLEIMQGAVLLALYCCTTQKWTTASLLTSMAASAAQDLGLNDSASLGQDSASTNNPHYKISLLRSLMNVIICEKVNSTCGVVSPLLDTESQNYNLPTRHLDESSWWNRSLNPDSDIFLEMCTSSAPPPIPNLLERLYTATTVFRRAASFAVMARLPQQKYPTNFLTDHMQMMPEMDGFLDSQLFKLPDLISSNDFLESTPKKSERLGEVTCRLFLHGTRVALHLFKVVWALEPDVVKDGEALTAKWEWSLEKAFKATEEASALLEASILKDEGDERVIWPAITIPMYYNYVFLLYLYSKLRVPGTCLKLESCQQVTVEKVEMQMVRHRRALRFLGRWWLCAGFHIEMLELLEACVRDGGDFVGECMALPGFLLSG
ncbi:hypothetical protein BC829DRAFT_406407 [Chytridium lagenaria]|nr:hypothetical protein BC829DRAFT_406407 [Chytridium lagenaria]